MKLFLFRIWIILLCLATSFESGIAQQINFVKLPLPDGVFTGLISGISQDPSGYMWFATGTGFFRYDGFKITYYDHQPSNPNSLAHDRIECIHADNNGIVWVGTYGHGLDRFDPVSETFTHYRHNPTDQTSLSSDTVTAILEDHEGTLWIGTYGGLNKLDQKSGTFISYGNKMNDPSSLSCDQVRVIYEDKEKTLWVGTGSPFFESNTTGQGGLNKFDSMTGKFTRYLHDPKNHQSLIDNRVRAIFEDSRGTFWVGTAGDGLHTMDRSTGIFERHLFDVQNPKKLSRPPLRKAISDNDDHITFIHEDATGSIWIGSFNGVNRYDTLTQKIKLYDSFIYPYSSYKDKRVWWAFNSHDGLLWMSTFSGSLYQVNPFQDTIPYYKLAGGANSIIRQAPGKYWIATYTHGLVLYDKKLGIQKKYNHDPLDPSSISNDTVNVIRLNKEGHLWIGTASGLDLFNIRKGIFTHYKHKSKDDKSIIHNYVFGLCVDKQENLWAGTLGGLDYLDVRSGRWTHYPYDQNDSTGTGFNGISSILEDRQNRIWFGSYYKGGIQLLNRKAGTFKKYLEDFNITSSIYQDSKNTIWVGTNDGLYWFHPASDHFIRFTDPDSVTEFSDVLNILEDSQNNLWVVTKTDLVMLDQDRNKIIRFGKSQGVHPNRFWAGDNGLGAGDEIFFGDDAGFYSFWPDSITVNTNPPKIHLADFRISDLLVEPGLNSAIKEPIWKASQIDLTYYQCVFSFLPVALHYIYPENNRLFYQLENYDETWRSSDPGQRAYYFNVPPGKYILKMKAANSNGVWAEKAIDVTIAPPWWRSWWAFSIYGIIIFAALRATHRYQKQRIIRTERDKAQEKELSQAREIEEAYRQLKSTQTQLIQSEKMASLGELTAGIAHEIQNPLNFVNNFSEVNAELIDELNAELAIGNLQQAKEIGENIKENEEKIIFHGKRADAIVKGMLQHSRASSGVKEPTDINALVDEYLRLAYHGLRAKDKSFNAIMKTDYDPAIGLINIIPQDIGRVILNLITNAFYAVSEKSKQSPEGYNGTVTVETRKNKSNIEIRVIDNGNGISQHVVDKIFQPFFTTKPTGQGTGLGLSLSYDIIKAHGGTIDVETQEGMGVSFIISIPE